MRDGETRDGETGNLSVSPSWIWLDHNSIGLIVDGLAGRLGRLVARLSGFRDMPSKQETKNDLTKSFNIIAVMMR